VDLYEFTAFFQIISAGAGNAMPMVSSSNSANSLALPECDAPRDRPLPEQKDRR
jgi:hypothetical protein